MNYIKKFENGIAIIKIFTYGNIIKNTKKEIIDLIKPKKENINEKILEAYIFLNGNIHNQFSKLEDILNWSPRIFYNMEDIIRYYDESMSKLCFSPKEITKQIHIYEDLGLVSTLDSIVEKNLIRNIRRNHNECMRVKGLIVDYVYDEFTPDSDINKTVMAYCKECNKYIVG